MRNESIAYSVILHVCHWLLLVLFKCTTQTTIKDICTLYSFKRHVLLIVVERKIKTSLSASTQH
jgi:hypothetical protein